MVPILWYSCSWPHLQWIAIFIILFPVQIAQLFQADSSCRSRNAKDTTESIYLHLVLVIKMPYSTTESPVSGNLWSNQKVDFHNPKLGSGLCRTKYYVRRTPSRIGNIPSQNRRQNRLLLTCVLVTVIYKQRAKSWFFKPFAHHYHRRI